MSAERQILSGHVPSAVQKFVSNGTPDPSRRLNLAISLPVRNREALDVFLKEISDPSNPNYRRYLTPEQFAENYGATLDDYQSVIKFVTAAGLTVTNTHGNRLVLSVEGAVSDIEKAFHVKMRTFPHPSEARSFYAPDTEPSLDLKTPILKIGGLDNYALPHSNAKSKPLAATANAGSGPVGSYGGNDFRTAYVPGTQLDGSNQRLALLEFDGYYSNDIAAYRTTFGLPNITLTNVAVDGGVSIVTGNNFEVALDIEIAIAMAPGLSEILVYEAPNPSPWVDILSKIADDNLARQISCSWSSNSGPDAAAEQIFQQMAAQGQSFFAASGDSDAYTGPIPFPCDSPNITVVGGTTLTMNGTAASYLSEVVWNWGFVSSANPPRYIGGSGGVSTYYPIPAWQQFVNMTANGGSSTMRNIPDVALTADNVYVRYDNGANGGQAIAGGTSCAAPLWAAFTAMVNQQASINLMPPVGFLNPTIYALEWNGSTELFHDINAGNNFSDISPSAFSAVSGFDLCVGWGTPNGRSLIFALAATPTAGRPASNERVLFNNPQGVAVDGQGSLYVVDSGNDTIRVMDIIGKVWTLSGSAGEVGSTNGPSGTGLLYALFNDPAGVAIDESHNIYIADAGNNTIRKLNWSTNAVTTLAGTAGSAGSANGTGSAARFRSPGAVAVDASGNVYVADTGNHTVRKITPAGAATTFAGTAGSPGNVDGTGAAARFNNPAGITIGLDGNLYVADTGNHTIRMITSTKIVTTLAGTPGVVGSADGTGSSALFSGPKGIAMDWGGKLYVADSGNNTIRKVSPDGTVVTVAGTAGVAGYADASSLAGSLYNNPTGVIVDLTGNIYVADTGNNTMRMLEPRDGVSTLGGTPGLPGNRDTADFGLGANYGMAGDSNGNLYITSNADVIYKLTPAGSLTYLAGYRAILGQFADGTGSAARFANLLGAACDVGGNIYVGDNGCIRKVTPAGVVTTLAGKSGTSGSVDGTGSAARFSTVNGVAVDAAGNVYVADYFNNTIRKMTPAGVVTTLAGSAGASGSVDGTGSAARFNEPLPIAVDSAGNVYVGDAGNNTIRKISASGVVTTLAGSPGVTGNVNGVGSAASFHAPSGLAVDPNGNVYVAEEGNNDIRVITPSGSVSTMVAFGGLPNVINYFAPDGLVAGMVFGPDGNLYVLASGNAVILQITPLGEVHVIAGTPNQAIPGTP